MATVNKSYFNLNEEKHLARRRSVEANLFTKSKRKYLNSHNIIKDNC